jgi:hypothetical protein
MILTGRVDLPGGAKPGTFRDNIVYPHMQEPPIEETATEARQAVKVPPMKYVLGIGLAGAAIGLLIAWLLVQ